MVKLGFWVFGEYYDQIGDEGHIEIAHRIFEKKKFWKKAFENETKFTDPVDFLIYRKGAVKIGNRYGMKVVTYSSLHLDKEMQTVILEYQSRGWKIEDIMEIAPR